jgi:ATP-dependent 26S proteasome regulatory subunit
MLLGDGPKLVRELFRVADELSPTIVFIGRVQGPLYELGVSVALNLRCHVDGTSWPQVLHVMLLGDGPKLVRELFRVADELNPSIVFMGAQRFE